jgi:hypothetical protein
VFAIVLAKFRDNDGVATPCRRGFKDLKGLRDWQFGGPQ